jgi:hypothetical protein
VLSFQRNKGMWTRKIYMKLAKKERRGNFSFSSGKEAKFMFCSLGCVEFAWIFIGIIWGQKSHSTFFFFELGI